jgi:3-hydroxy-9,10-secoandrosta-1,3,5(10)-triene-9,17-dione monooxygenase reductase component
MSDPVDPGEFRSALGSFATGVTIVTTRDGDGRDIGLTANSFNSVSLDPPMVLWSLSKTSTSLAAFSQAQHFAVHVLAADQETLSNQFARKGADKLAGSEPRRGAGQVPLLGGCTALFQCRTAYKYEGGDHVIFVGEVIDFEHLDKPPLVFHGGRYAVAKSKPAPPQFAGDLGETSLGTLLTRAYVQLVTPLRRSAEQMGLSAPERYTMNVLMGDAAHDLAEINGVIGHTGVRATEETTARLLGRGLIESASPTNSERFRLTDAGREAALELMAAATALEADALAGMSDDEQRILRHLLTRLVEGLASHHHQPLAHHLDLIRAAVDRARSDHAEGTSAA